MFLPPSLITENSFWLSEQWLLTSNWMKIFSLTTWKIYSRYPTRPKSPSFARRVDADIGDSGRGALWEFVGEWVTRPPQPSVLFVNMQSLENILDELRSRLSYQQGIKSCNILCFDSMDNDSWLVFPCVGKIEQLPPVKQGVAVCLFVNNSWCAKLNIKEVSRFCSPEVENLMISCRPHYLPRKFSPIFFIAVYLPPQTDAGTKIALNELYKAIIKQ